MAREHVGGCYLYGSWEAWDAYLVALKQQPFWDRIEWVFIPLRVGEFGRFMPRAERYLRHDPHACGYIQPVFLPNYYPDVHRMLDIADIVGLVRLHTQWLGFKSGFWCPETKNARTEVAN